MKKLPVPCILIKGWTDQLLVRELLKYAPIPTEEFFYGRCYPMFKALHTRYTTDCVGVLEFTNEMYLYIMKPQTSKGQCKLETFKYQCALHNWIGVVSLRYCYATYKRNKKIYLLEDSRNEDIDASIFTEIHLMEQNDVERILEQMRNHRYREIIRLRYLKGYSNEETAIELGMEMKIYYNKHLLAKAQYIAAYKKEMGL